MRGGARGGSAGSAVGADPSAAAWFAGLGQAPLAPHAQGIGQSLCDSGLTGCAGGSVGREGCSGGGRYAGADLPQPRLQLRVDSVATAGDCSGLRGLGGAGGDGAAGAGQLCGPGGLVVRVDGRRGIGVPRQAVAPVALPGAGHVRGQDLVRRGADVLAGGDADVPAVRGGHRHVAEQLVPLGELVARLALVGADGAGVESADVGQQGCDFAAVHGQPSVPVGSSRAASRAAVWASVRVMPPGTAVFLPGTA